MDIKKLEKVHETANAIYNSIYLSAEEKYERIFSDDISKVVFAEVRLEYCDPDTGYEEDVNAFMMAFNEKMKELVGSKDDYWAKTVEYIMVPVVVKYHSATDVVFTFTPPTMLDVEEAVKKRYVRK